jgi:hypothetical protein
MGGSTSRKASTYTHTSKQTQIFMPRVGFEPSILVFEQAKVHHALDSVANVIGAIMNELLKILTNLIPFACNMSKNLPSHASL